MKKSLAAIILAIVATTSLFISTSQHTSAEGSCQELNVIFARGSGEETGSTNANRFLDQIRARLSSSDLNVNYHELTKEEYPAVSVDPWSHIDNLIGALTSAGLSNNYGESVDNGIGSLVTYIKQHDESCHNAKYIIGGYSQGAQLAGQSLQHLGSDIHDRILFVALFGDPKLDLPEGKGINPPACSGNDPSPWRRSIGDCHTSAGVLGARTPYMPVSLEQKTGLWCNAQDIICGSSLKEEGHGWYANENGAIDQAALEIAQRVQKTILQPSPHNVNIKPLSSGFIDQGPDVMFVIENSTFMTRDYFQNFVGPRVHAIVNDTIAKSGRVGLLYFSGCQPKGMAYMQRLNSIPSVEFRDIEYAPLLSPRCDLSADLYDSIKYVKEKAGWKSGVKKTIVVITKAPFHAPIEVIPGKASRTLHTTKLAIAGDNADITIYPIVPDDIADSYSGQNVNGSPFSLMTPGDIENFVEANTIHPQIVAELRGPNIVTHPNQLVTFDASSSLVYDDTITSYAWDFDGNGTIDTTTTQPTIEYAYPSEFNGELRVTVSTVTGLQDTTSEKVTIKDGELFPPSPAPPQGLKIAKTSSSTIKLTWQNGSDNRAAYWGVSLNGVPLGKVVKDQFYINISDIKMDQENEFSVQAITAEGELGDAAIVSLNDATPATQGNLITNPADTLIQFAKAKIDTLNQLLKDLPQTISALHIKNSSATAEDTNAQKSPADKTSLVTLYLWVEQQLLHF